MMPARMYDLTAMKAPVEQPVLCRDLVSCQDFSPDETKSMFELTHIIKHRPADFRGALAGKQLVLFFEKASLRTRLTFEAGMASLGGTSLFMDQTRSLLGEREPVCDIARNVERWVDAGKREVLVHEKGSAAQAGHAGFKRQARAQRCFFMDQTRSLLGEREPVCDIARNVERWVDAVVLRTFEHKTIVDMA